MNIVYSLNTYPITHNRWNMGDRLLDTIKMTAVSVLYSCMWYDNVKLYIDPIGYALLNSLPCDVIKVDFHNDPELWMKSKIVTISAQKEPFVHVDNDVFLKKPISFDFEKILVERKDLGFHNYKTLISFFDQYCNDFSFWNPSLTYAWSCGIIGFQDMKLKQEFVDTFNTLENLFVSKRDDFMNFKNDIPNKGHHLEPGLLLEQYNLASLLAIKNIDPEILIPGETHQKQSDYANSIGYAHLFGASKYHPKNISSIEKLLKTKFYESYQKIEKKLKTRELSSV